MDYTIPMVRLFSSAIDEEEQAKNKLFLICCRAAQLEPKDYKKIFEEMFD